MLLVLVACLWIYNGYEMATGFGGMSLFKRFDAVLFLIMGPMIFWRSFSELSSTNP